MNSALRRIWLLTAQVIAVAAGVLISWRAFGPIPQNSAPRDRKESGNRMATQRRTRPTAKPSLGSV